jgi:hypothetical protein
MNALLRKRGEAVSGSGLAWLKVLQIVQGRLQTGERETAPSAPKYRLRPTALSAATA